MKYYLESLGCISPLGANLREISLAGSEKKPFCEDLSFQLKGKKRNIQVERALEPTIKLKVPDSVLRRMSRSTKLVLSAVEEAKIRSARKWDSVEGARTGIIVGTNNGPAQTNLDYIQRLLQFDFEGASPNLFAQSVPNNIASSIAMSNKWKGPTLTLIHRQNLWKSVAQVAQNWMVHDKVDSLWLVLGNEVSLQGSYAQLYDHVQENPSSETFCPEAAEKPTEAYSCFLLVNEKTAGENAVDFDLKSSLERLAVLNDENGYKLTRPEELGPKLALSYYNELFASKERERL